MRCLLVTIICLACSALAVEKPNAALRAGAAAVDITPDKLPVSMTGSFQDRQATGVHDPLHARALVLDDGSTRAAIVVCDVCLISRDILDAAKDEAAQKTGIPASHMLISATHTHTAPTVVPLAQCRPDPAYVRLLTERIVEAVVVANGRLEPARVGWTAGSAPDEVGNRRWFVEPEAIVANPFGRTDDRVRTNPPRDNEILIRAAGPVDPEVGILSVQSRDKQPLALLANYGLHYVGGIPSDQLSADYFGEFARQVGQRLNADDNFVGIMSNGTSGDVNNYDFRNPRPRAEPFERVREVAARIADVVKKAHGTIEFRESLSIAVVEQTMELDVRRPNERELMRAREMLASAADPKRLNIAELYAQESIRLAEGPATVNVKLQVMRIGELGIVAMPCEAFAEIGLEIKRRSPLDQTFVVTLANGYNGYLPTPEQHALGGYETWRSGWSYLEVDASRKMTEVLVEMLDRVSTR